MHFYILHYTNRTIYSRNYNFSFHLQNSNYWLRLTISYLLRQIHSIPRRSRQNWKECSNKVNYTFQHYGTVKHFSRLLKIIQGDYCYVGSPGYHFNILDELSCWILLKKSKCSLVPPLNFCLAEDQGPCVIFCSLLPKSSCAWCTPFSSNT